MSGQFSEAAHAMHTQKKYAAHTYVSVKCNVSDIVKQINQIGDSNIQFENFLLKAVSKAFSKAFPDNGAVNISRVVNAGGLQVYGAANESQLGSLSNSEIHSDILNFSNAAPESHVTVSQVDQAIDCLPIVSSRSMISLHYSAPTNEVSPGGSTQIFDIETLDEEDLDYSLNLNVGQTSKITISFDI